MIIWDEWASQMDQDQLIGYFKKHTPIPVEWLAWVAGRLGDEDIYDELVQGGGRFESIQWLEQQGLGSFDEFKSWYDENWQGKKRTDE